MQNKKSLIKIRKVKSQVAVTSRSHTHPTCEHRNNNKRNVNFRWCYPVAVLMRLSFFFPLNSINVFISLLSEFSFHFTCWEHSSFYTRWTSTSHTERHTHTKKRTNIYSNMLNASKVSTAIVIYTESGNRDNQMQISRATLHSGR